MGGALRLEYSLPEPSRSTLMLLLKPKRTAIDRAIQDGLDMSWDVYLSIPGSPAPVDFLSPTAHQR